MGILHCKQYEEKILKGVSKIYGWIKESDFHISNLCKKSAQFWFISKCKKMTLEWTLQKTKLWFFLLYDSQTVFIAGT